ncbi:MAG: Appr-1-p processing protein [Candidatus Hecatellales archaeon B24]|nr:MAG: Appr-1-p processing protein [Candidatus Hecatellales archaeon B24]
MGFEVESRGISFKALKADLTRLEVDALVNPANSLLIMGGGVAGALKRAGGLEIEREARRYAPCPVGEAVATTAGKLKAKHVIHAPTMERPAMATSPEKVYKATLAALKCADKVKASSIALPAMGAGVGGVPPVKAAEAMVKAAREHLKANVNLRKVVFVGLSEDVVQAFERALKHVLLEKA